MINGSLTVLAKIALLSLFKQGPKYAYGMPYFTSVSILESKMFAVICQAWIREYLLLIFYLYDQCRDMTRTGVYVYSIKEPVLKNFGKFTGKQLCRSAFYNKG